MGRIERNGTEPAQSLHGKVFEQLEEDIISGKYKPGDCLNELKLTKEMGVSRTPIREAIRQLELEGLVAYTPNRGVVVRGLSREDVTDIYQIRLMLEGMTARRAAEKITPEQLDALEEIVELEEFYTEKGNAQQLSRLDTRFHETIYQAGGSHMIAKTMKAFHHYVKSERDISLSIPERAKNTYLEHKAVYDAIRAREREQAEILMERHIQNATESIEKSARKGKE